MSEFVDTSLFIRLLAKDDPRKLADSLELFQRARRGEVDLVTSETVVAEIVYVLASLVTYRTPRPDIARVLRSVLSNPGLRIDHKGSVLGALDLWEASNLDYEACLSVEHVRRQRLDGISSDDRDFDRIPGVRRLEP